MLEDSRLSRVEILLKQQRYKEAEKILQSLLSEDINNVHYLTIHAELKLQMDDFESAITIIDRAIGLEPDHSTLFYIKARIKIQQNQLESAESLIKEAIKLDPFDADYFALLANINLGRKQFDIALKNANKALEIDAQNLNALNTRSTALNKLDRNDESYQTIEGALREDPNNPYTHANYGWGLLENGQHEKALEHFHEALKIDPDFEFAQAGMLQAIKAKNPFYRMFLKYAFWMGNMAAKNQWVVILGFYFGFRFLRVFSKNNPALQPFLTPLLIILAVLAFSTWIMEPISNLFLRFNKYGKVLLSKDEKTSSNFVAISLAVFVIGLLLYLILSDQRFLAVAVFGFAMMVPFGSMFSSKAKRKPFLIYAVAMAVIGLAAVSLTFITGELFNPMSVVFMLGFIGFQWIANFILIKENNH